MKTKNIVLAGATLLMMTVTASAQRRGVFYGSRSVYPNAGYGAATPFGNLGNPYGTGYNSGYGYNNAYGNNNYGNGYGANRFGQSYGTNGYTQNSYYTPQTTAVPQNVVPGAYTVPNTTTTTAASGPMGLRITELKDGPAKDAGLRQGDVILSVDGKRTQNFDELRSVLKDTEKKEVKVEFIDGSNGKTETKKVAVQNSKFGVTVDETLVNQ